MARCISLVLALVALSSQANAQVGAPALDEARALVLVATAGAVHPGASACATEEAVRRERLAIDDALLSLPDLSARTQARLQITAAALDIAALDEPSAPGDGDLHPWDSTAATHEQVELVASRRLVRVDDAPDVGGWEAGPSRTLVHTTHGSAPEVERELLRTSGASEIWAEPVGAPRVTSRFGPRVDPITGQAGRMHRGIDYGGSTGDPVLAAASGEVILGGYCDRGTGNCIVIEHEGGWRTQYFHLSEVHVRPGDEVSQGEVIGEIGSTGRSTGPHLHFQVGRGTEAVDPETMFGTPVR